MLGGGSVLAPSVLLHHGTTQAPVGGKVDAGGAGSLLQAAELLLLMVVILIT